MKIFKFLSAAIFAIAALSTGQAAASDYTTGQFLADCDGSAGQRTLCLSYAAAVADSFVALSLSSLKSGDDKIQLAGICVSAHTPFSAAGMINRARSFVNKTRAEAAEATVWLPAVATILAGLREAYPCPKD